MQAHGNGPLGNRKPLRARPSDPPRNDQPRQGESREHRRDDADAERHGKTTHRPGPDEEQHRRRDESGDVGIENGRERTREASVDGSNRRTPGADLFPDALVDEHVAVDRNADRQHDADDAGQCQGRVEQREHAKNHSDVHPHRDAREHAEHAVGHHHEYNHERGAVVGGGAALLDRVLAQPGTNDALLDHGQLGRQGTRAQQDRQIVGGFDGETAGDLTGAADNGLADHRRGNHLVIEYDREPASDILTRGLGKLARARIVELERDDGLAGALIETGLGIGQLLTRDDDAGLEQIGFFALLRRPIDDFRARRRTALQRLFWARRGVDHAERELGSLADEIDQLLRVSETRHLHQDAVVSLSLDRRLHQTKLVDPTANDLDRLIDHLTHALEDRRIGYGEPNQPTADVLNIERTLSGGAEHASERLRKLSQLRQSLLKIALTDMDLDAVAPDHWRAGETDPRLPQNLADVILQGHELLSAHVALVDLQQDMRASLQVEPEHHMALCPFGQFPDGALGEEV